MSWWSKNRKYVIGGTIAVAATAAGAAIGGGTGALVGANLGLNAANAYIGIDAQREQEKSMAAIAEQAEALASSGQTVTSEEQKATEDLAGNETYKKKQQQYYGSLALGRGGTQLTASNLGGGGTLGGSRN